ncbi:hypothetical protein ACWY4P_01515 [Streptomyces sp. LZ34]
MKLQDLLGTSDGFAVADSFALYEIAVDHTSTASLVKEAALTNDIHLVVPAVTLAVSCSMRNCWDELCTKGHQFGAGSAVQSLLNRGGIRLLELTPADAVSAGKIYARSADQRVEGPEVLAACHASLLAAGRNMPLLSTARASYCYATMEEALQHQIRLI